MYVLLVSTCSSRFGCPDPIATLETVPLPPARNPRTGATQLEKEPKYPVTFQLGPSLDSLPFPSLFPPHLPKIHLGHTFTLWHLPNIHTQPFLLLPSFSTTCSPPSINPTDPIGRALNPALYYRFYLSITTPLTHHYIGSLTLTLSSVQPSAFTATLFQSG